MRLVTFLGTGNYSETTYNFEGAECQTRYVAAALATFLEVESIVVLATKEAYESHAQGVTKELARLGLPSPVIQLIPSGGNTDELWEQFGVISDAVTSGEPESVSFDITHGFRSQPFFAAAVINYLRATLSEAPEMYAYYGEWLKGRDISPIWDISTFISLLDWSSALHGFMKTGHGAELSLLARQENIKIQKTSKGERPITLDKLATSIRKFSENISTVRVINLIIGPDTQGGSAANVLKCIAASEGEVRKYLPPLFPILMELKGKVANIPADNLFGEDGANAMLNLARLYVDYERYPEAAIVLREGWVSLYADTKLSEDDLLTKTERDVTEIRWRDAEDELVHRSGSANFLGSVRNDIQHGGFNSNPSPADKLITNLSRLIDGFEEKINDKNGLS